MLPGFSHGGLRFLMRGLGMVKRLVLGERPDSLRQRISGKAFPKPRMKNCSS